MSTDDQGSVTRWIGQLQTGDPAAAQLLWDRYFRRMVGLARKKLEGAKRGAADEEDVALSAFDSFCRMNWVVSHNWTIATASGGCWWC